MEWSPEAIESLIGLENDPPWQRRLRLSEASGYPRFLYKYRSISEAELGGKDAFLKDILECDRLWMAAPHDFNDPFDGMVSVELSTTRRNVRNELTRMFSRAGGISKKRARRLVVEKGAVDSAAEQIPEVFHRNQAKTGVISFASTPRDILMWSHYADAHRGIVLQFELTKDMRAFCWAHPISYSDDYPSVIFGDSQADLGSVAIDALLHKSEHWKYEGEWRILWLDKARTHFRFAPQSLRAVILGARISQAVETYVRRLIDARSKRGYLVKLYRASLSSTRYNLRFSRVL